MSLKRWLLTAAAAWVGFGCAEPVDRVAKERIFSAEDPPKVVASAKETLDVQALAQSPEGVRRLLTMDAAEVTERLGPHRAESTLAYEWTSATGAVKLSETRTFLAGPGGVNGDFHGVMENSRDQGLEVLRVKGQVFARNRHGPFRQRLRDRGMAERSRRELTGALRDVDALFLGRLQLTDKGTTTVEGREARRFALSLGEGASQRETPAVPLPSLLAAKSGRDASSQRRSAFFEKRVPQSIDGELWVDARTSVVMKVQLTALLKVPASDRGGAASLKLRLDSALSQVGKDPKLVPPENFLPDADKPQGIADALDRFGVPRAGSRPDAGTTAEPEEEEGG